MGKQTFPFLVGHYQKKERLDMGLDHEGSYKMMTSLESKTQMHFFRRCPEETRLAL